MRYFSIFILLNIISTSYSFSGEKKKEPKKEPIYINSDSMISNKKKNVITFIDNVEAYKGDLTIKSKKLEVYKDDKTKKLKQFIATGDVKIKKGDDIRAVCGKAIYNEQEQMITLLVNPVVTKNENEIKGSKIIFYIKDENVRAFSDNKNRVNVILFPDDLEKEKN